MTQPIVYIDTSTVRKGKLNELKAAMPRLAAFVEANVPQILSYAFYLDDAEEVMTVVSVHRDSDALEFHMETGREEFRKFGAFIELEAIEVYGAVTDSALERLEAKARMLGRGAVSVHHFHAGFTR